MLADRTTNGIAIEQACGVVVRGYRAPSYSVTERSLWALDVLVREGYAYDSSIYPISHDRYGIPGSPRYPHVIETPAGPIREFPIATVELSKGRVVPRPSDNIVPSNNTAPG